MHALGKKVPDKDPTKQENIVLDNLQQVEATDCFGHLSFNGRFREAGVNLLLTQNFDHGIFAQLDIPIRRLEVRNVSYSDCSADKKDPNWQAFLASFSSILTLYELDIRSCKQTGIGDMSLLLGWTRNYEETEYLDFIDWTLKTGVLFPTGEKRSIQNAFSLPNGYDGHWGIPLCGDVSIGLFEWITLGLHLQLLPLVKKTGMVRMKTACEQSGMIKLAKGYAQIKPSMVTHVGCFAQADHIIRGLSLTIGYSYAHQGSTKICPCDDQAFSPEVVNTDQMFKSWSVHTVHFQADYDFTKEHHRVGARVGVFVDWHVGGKRTFKMNRSGPFIGLDFLLEA